MARRSGGVRREARGERREEREERERETGFSTLALATRLLFPSGIYIYVSREAEFRIFFEKDANVGETRGHLSLSCLFSVEREEDRSNGG